MSFDISLNFEIVHLLLNPYIVYSDCLINIKVKTVLSSI